MEGHESDDKSTPTSSTTKEHTKKRSLSEMRLSSDTTGSLYPPSLLFDEHSYLLKVRRLPPSSAEQDLEEDLHRQALLQGIELPHTLDELRGIKSSISGTTVLSDKTNMQGSIMSGSTAPTSCSSSERSPARDNILLSATTSPELQSTPSPNSADKKRTSIFRSGVRRIVGLKKRGTDVTELRFRSPGTPTVQTPGNSQLPIDQPKSGRPASLRSTRSSWLSQAILPKPSDDDDEIDPLILSRSMECTEFLELQSAQTAERDRFIDFRRQSIDQLRSECNEVKAQTKVRHDAAIADQSRLDDLAVEDLEEKQLQEELKLAEEHRFRERMMNSRLRHIERFVTNPTPPPTPSMADMDDGASEGSSPPRSPSISSLPTRPAAGPSEYNHLAEQYRARKNLVHVNESKINVLRGQQQRSMELFIKQQRDTMTSLENARQEELATIDADYVHKEKALNDILNSKRALLEFYWYKQALFAQQKKERATGLKYRAPPPVTVAD